MSSITHPVPGWLAGDPVISAVAGRLVTVPLGDLAHPDGSPRPGFAGQARRDYRQARRPFPGSAQDLAATPGAVGMAVLARRAQLRASWPGLPDMPGIHPESAAVTQLIEHLRGRPRATARTGPLTAGTIAGVMFVIEAREGRLIVTLGSHDRHGDEGGLLGTDPETGLAVAEIRTADEAGGTCLRAVTGLRPALPRPPVLLCDACYQAGTSLTAVCQDSCALDLDHTGLCDWPGWPDWCQWCGATDRLHETPRSSISGWNLPAAAQNSDGTWQLTFGCSEQAGPFSGPAQAWAWWHANGTQA